MLPGQACNPLEPPLPQERLCKRDGFLFGHALRRCRRDAHFPGEFGSIQEGIISIVLVERQEETEPAEHLENKVRVDQMSVSGMIRDNTLEIFPFVLDIDRYVLAASGLQHFDESFQYHLSLIKSPLLVKFGVNIWGPGFGDIHYGVGKARYRNTQVPAFTRQLDTIQLNLLASIHNIFEIGVERAMAENRSLRLVEERMEAMGFSEAEPPVETSEGVPAQDASWMEPIRSHATQRREAIREEVLEAIENEEHE